MSQSNIANNLFVPFSSMRYWEVCITSHQWLPKFLELQIAFAL